MTNRHAVYSDHDRPILRAGFWFRPGLQVLRPECLRIVQAKGAFDDPNIRDLGPIAEHDETRVDHATPADAAAEEPTGDPTPVARESDAGQTTHGAAAPRGKPDGRRPSSGRNSKRQRKKRRKR